MTPPVIEVMNLETTERGDGAFGSTEEFEPEIEPTIETQELAFSAASKKSLINRLYNMEATIDAEIHACMEALSAFKIHYLDRKEITLRTDCQAIIKFFNKSVSNKPSRVRWIAFTDYITGTGINIEFEHVEGTNNQLADALSRIVHHVTSKVTLPECQLQLLKQVCDSIEETQDASDSVKEDILVKVASTGLSKIKRAGAQEKSEKGFYGKLEGDSKVSIAEYKSIIELLKQNQEEIIKISQEQEKLRKGVLLLQREILLFQPATKEDLKKLISEIAELQKILGLVKQLEGLHLHKERNAGVNALVVLRDTRWRDDRSIIGTMEVDLTGGTQLVYIAPNMLISIEDFYNHMELAIQTHGYEEWNSAESNLLITRGLIGRLTNTSHADFRYNVQNVADYLASTGIHAVAASPRTTNEGYQASKKQEPRRFSNFDTERITDEGEEEFADIPQPTGWGDEETSEVVFPSIWEDTPWEEDPELEIPTFPEEEYLFENENDEREAYFLGLENLENDYPSLSPESVLQPQWDDEDEEAEEYCMVEQVANENVLASSSAISRYNPPQEPLMGQQTGNIARAAILDQLDLPSEYDVLSVDINEADSDAICSFSEGETGTGYINLMLDDTPWMQDTVYMLGAENCGWRSQVFVGDKMKNCQHQWEENQVIMDSKYLCCTLCKLITTDTMRIHCLKCRMTVCPACGPFYLNKTLKLKKAEIIPPYHKEERVIQELLDYTSYLRSIMNQKPQQEDYQFLRIKCLTNTAKLPIRQTKGAAGYDLFLDEEVHIPPQQQQIVKTGINIEFSDGYYARIAPRSGAAFRLNCLINAGVIDSDFRGEWKEWLPGAQFFPSLRSNAMVNSVLIVSPRTSFTLSLAS
ncbi:hypothetical protein ZIOFF_068257 [Zingiber officinale]|uniref:dUTP diphosphatase n=1 Tax=Zingiber officinale TaxID=94328 RepID=A0A8J5EVL4_ZINOF|nr:hypothetical protein ZIOFF_068257 [Zingiber officinale]